MLAMDAVGTCGGEVFFDGDARSQDGEERSENGSEIKNGYVSNDGQNNSSLMNKLTIISATSLLNLFVCGFGKYLEDLLRNVLFIVDRAFVRW